MTFKPADYLDRVTIGGGDLAATIVSRGWPDRDSIDRAILVRPELVRDAADEFVDAGAEILLTLTLRANALRPAFPDGRSRIDFADVAKANQKAAAVLRTAADGHPSGNGLVFGVVGPPPGLLSLDEIKKDDLRQSYEVQIRALADGGADAVLCQSFTEIGPLCIAVEAAVSSCDLPVIGCMTFDCGPERTETTSGVSVSQACSSVLEAGVAAVGCDGGESPDTVPAVVGLMRESSTLPIWVTVRAGAPELNDRRPVYTETAQTFGERLPALAAAGVTFLGGGAGVTPEHVAAMVAARKRLGSRR